MRGSFGFVMTVGLVRALGHGTAMRLGFVGGRPAVAMHTPIESFTVNLFFMRLSIGRFDFFQEVWRPIFPFGGKTFWVGALVPLVEPFLD